jgi:2-hydroxychromene-2-carboxylate isomerase
MTTTGGRDVAKRPGTKSSVKGAGKLPASAFAYPKQRKYPINTLKRARAALAYAARGGTFGSYEHVARRVRAKYGNKVASVGRAKGTLSRPGRKGKG